MIGILPEHRYYEWDNFVEHHPLGSIYHTTNWIKVLKNSFNIKPVIFCDYDNLSINAGIPLFLHINFIRGKRLISITSAQSCNPLVNSSEQLYLLLDYIKKYIVKENIDFAQLRVNEEFNFHIDDLLCNDSDFFTYLIDLDKPYEEIRKNFHQSCIIRHLKKANTSDFSLVENLNESYLKAFYNNYEIMRKVHGILPQPFMFFSNLVNAFSKKNMVDVFHIIHNDRVISSVINLKFKDRYIYEYGASDKNFLNLHPSHFLINSSIRRAISQEFKIFDFGRTDSTNPGLDNFKRRWGGRKSYFRYYYLTNKNQKFRPDKSNVSAFTHSIINHTPKPIYHLIGPLVYKKVF